MDNDVLDKVEEYASLFFTVDEISLMLNLDASQFRREIRFVKTDLAKAYHRGKLKSMLDIRRTTVEFAKKGSPQAEAFVKDYIDKQKSNE